LGVSDSPGVIFENCGAPRCACTRAPAIAAPRGSIESESATA
jgi:hypothetical protein